MLAQMIDGVGDPVDVLLDRRDHLRLHSRAAGPGDDEHVGKARDHQAEVRERPTFPVLAKGGAIARAHVDLLQRAGHGVEARGEDQRIELVGRAGLELHARGRDLLDGIGAHPDQRHVRPVVGLVVMRIEAQALGADRMVVGRQQLGGLPILHHGTDLVAHELRGRVVGLLADQQIGVGIKVADRAALGPLGLVDPGALLGRGLERLLRRLGIAAYCERRTHCCRPARGILRLVCAFLLFAHRAVAGRQAEVGGALEHREVLGVLRDDRDHLHAGRACADRAHALAGEVDTFMRPQAGVIPFTLEVMDALEVGHPRRREIARRHDDVARADLFAGLRLQDPLVGLAVEQRGLDARVELHVAAQVEAVGDVVDVFQDLGLRAVALRPFPFLLQLVGEAVGIFQAFHVAARAGIAVPEPGAADAGPGFVSAHFQADAAQAMDGIETGETAADNNHV